MNIMYLIFSFNIGGIERLLIDLTKEMARRGNHVFLCVINHDYTASLLKQVDPAVRIILLNRRPGKEGVSASGSSGNDNTDIKAAESNADISSEAASAKLSRIIRDQHIEILHCQGINCVLFAAPAKLCSPKLIVVNTVHDQGNYRSYPAWKVMLANRILDHTIAISDSVRKEILSRRLNPEKVTTIHNAVDTQRFYYSGRTHDNVRRIRSGQIEIGNVARFYPAKKGQDLLVKSVELLLPEYPLLHCTFAGGIYKGQEQPFSELRDYISGHHLSDHFRFLGDIDDVPAFLHSCDLFALPSRYEGFGISLIEAMACGLPCVASNLDGPAEIMQGGPQDEAAPAYSDPGAKDTWNENLGQLFKPGDAEDLAKALRMVVQRLQGSGYNPKEISEYATSNFDIRHMADRHEVLYRDLLNK